MKQNRLTSILNRAEKKFGQSSGWKPRQLQTTLQNFSKLNPVHQFFFGGILFSHALMRTQSPKKLPKSKRVSGRA